MKKEPQRSFGRTGIARLARLQPWYVLTSKPTKLRQFVFTMVNSCIAIVTMGAAAILCEQHFLFPSLGPSAILFFSQPASEKSCPRNAILGHGAAIIFGSIAYHLFIDYGQTGTLIAIGLSFAAINAFTTLYKMPHPPAASTTLVVSMGVVVEPLHLFVLLLAVFFLTAEAWLLNRVCGIAYPMWAPLRDDAPKDMQLPVRALQTGVPKAPPSRYANLADAMVERRAPEAAPVEVPEPVGSPDN